MPCHPYRLLRTLAAVVSAGSALSCATADIKNGFNGDPNAVLAQVIISPNVLTIQAQATLIFSFYGRTVGGDSVAVALNWVATGGNLGPNGEFMSDTAGVFMVIGEAVQNPFPADTAFITVSVPPPVEQSITVAPQQTTLAPGGTRTFSATS